MSGGPPETPDLFTQVTVTGECETSQSCCNVLSREEFLLHDVMHVTSMSRHRWIRATSVSTEFDQLFHDSF